jgi:DNA-directed RNA polymerase specialized sigma subunit
MTDPANVTGLLVARGKGDDDAFQRLVPLVERELHRIAERCMAGERAGHSLQATALAKFDERKSKVIELRFFGGLSVEETASVLNVSVDTVMRDWKLAKAWLSREMRSGT